MDLTRRQFLVLTAGVAVVPLEMWTVAAAKAAGGSQSIDIGPAASYAADAVYDQFRTRGFFVIHRDGRTFALSSTCTHKGCTLRTNAKDQTFYCKCHGSRFDKDGRVTKGPARRSLPQLAVKQDDRQHLIVDLAYPAS